MLARRKMNKNIDIQKDLAYSPAAKKQYFIKQIK